MTRIVQLVGKATGGIGMHVRDLADGLRASGADVIVATDPLTARTFALTDAVLAWPDPRHPNPRALAALRRLLLSADVVHAHGHQAGALAAALLATRPEFRRGTRAGRRAPALVVSLHNEPPPLSGAAARLAERLERRTMRAADLVTGASADLVARAAEFGARRARLAEVPSPRVPELLAAHANAETGADAKRRAREEVEAAYGLDPGRPLVLTISRIAPQKELSVLVAAQRQVHREHEWVVVGSGMPDLLAQLRADALVSPSGDRRLHFVGSVADPTPLLRAADLFVLTSRWEARALVVQEAMAAGLAVVATEVGGLPDLVDERTGILVPPGAPAAIAAAVDLLLADPERRADLGAAGRERAASWSRHTDLADEWLGAYADLMGGIP